MLSSGISGICLLNCIIIYCSQVLFIRVHIVHDHRDSRRVVVSAAYYSTVRQAPSRYRRWARPLRVCAHSAERMGNDYHILLRKIVLIQHNNDLYYTLNKI